MVNIATGTVLFIMIDPELAMYKFDGLEEGSGSYYTSPALSFSYQKKTVRIRRASYQGSGM